MIYYGNSPACDEIDTDGFYMLNFLKQDTNDSGNVDLVLYLYPNSRYFDFVEEYDWQTHMGEKIFVELYLPNAIGASNLSTLTFTLRSHTHFVDSVKLDHVMQESARQINDVYDYELPKITVNYNENKCNTGTQYVPGSNKVIFLDDLVHPLCNIHEMYGSDTPKHEYYH